MTKKTNKKQDLKNHPSNPANQPFNVSAKPNKTKKDSWWKKFK